LVGNVASRDYIIFWPFLLNKKLLNKKLLSKKLLIKKLFIYAV